MNKTLLANHILCHGAWLGWARFPRLLPSLFEEAVLNLLAKNMSTTVENFQLFLDSHRWAPLPAVGFPSNNSNDESLDDITPPSYLMEHPPLAVFVNDNTVLSNFDKLNVLCN